MAVPSIIEASTGIIYKQKSRWVAAIASVTFVQIIVGLIIIYSVS
jgi:hypothetical protein